MDVLLLHIPYRLFYLLPPLLYIKAWHFFNSKWKQWKTFEEKWGRCDVMPHHCGPILNGQFNILQRTTKSEIFFKVLLNNILWHNFYTSYRKFFIQITFFKVPKGCIKFHPHLSPNCVLYINFIVLHILHIMNTSIVLGLSKKLFEGWTVV